MKDKISSIRREAAARVLPSLPSPLRSRLVDPKYNWSRADLRNVATAPEGDKRLLIAPANYGVQGHYWARAAETLPGVSAVNMRFVSDNPTMGSPSDFSVRRNVGQWSHIWGRNQFEAIKDGFTHVLIEAELPILGGLHEGDLRREIDALQNAGIKVATVAHGTDVRLPSKHRELEEFSPFVEGFPHLDALEKKVRENHKLLDELGLPEFVSTPDLLQFRPNATWLPTVSDSEKWGNLQKPQLEDHKPVVLHMTSRRPALKGGPHIDAAMRRLEDEGLIEYVAADKIPFAEMPALVERSDIIINQVAMGLYAMVAIEGMMAGRIVVSQVWDSVRETIRNETGLDVPVVEANPDTLYQVVKDIVQNPDQYSHLGPAGQEFAKQVHSKERAAAALSGFLET